MLKKSILIENKTSITTKNNQLVLKSEIRESSIPVEDIGYIVLDYAEIYLNLFYISNYCVQKHRVWTHCMWTGGDLSVRDLLL